MGLLALRPVAVLVRPVAGVVDESELLLEHVDALLLRRRLRFFIVLIIGVCGWGLRLGFCGWVFVVGQIVWRESELLL